MRLSGVTACVTWTGINLVNSNLLQPRAQAKPELRLTSEGIFDIMQFADLHFGEDEDGDWGPKQDRESRQLMERVIAKEKPHLIAFTGDQVTGNNVAKNLTAVWHQAVEAAGANSIPYIALLGNHDTMPLEGPNASLGNRTAEARRMLMEFDSSLPFSLSQVGPLNIRGSSNYFVPVWPNSEQSPRRPAVLLYVLDSGGGTLAEDVFPETVEWFRNVTRSNIKQWGLIPSLLFVHIPLPEFQGQNQLACIGVAQEGVTPTQDDTGLFAAASNGNIHAVIVGHDHGNDIACLTSKKSQPNLRPLWLAFGRHSGYGGYGDWARGSRMFRFNSSAESTRKCGFSTWVRMENGSMIDGGEMCSHGANLLDELFV
eukprot:TRINITY_DN17937_c3_g1_i1.p1 TRINITY_DN17937_c3_g1~~TRINITY_DN17937_c3_g1_i1.p1  ORF type:complete len:370 (+),score=39.16 TRINITY_DN17937_c3_g1_i1:173-1282(+)